VKKDIQMKAIVYTKYGPPDVLQLREVAKPVPKDNQVLVKVQAASANALDFRRFTSTSMVGLCWLLGISVLKEEGNEYSGKPCPFCGERGKEVRRAHHLCTLGGPLLERISQARCLCEAEKRMIRRI
jgi:hypothetical protein